MNPQSCKIEVPSTIVSGIGLHHVLNDLGEVTQVELIVELLGGGHKLRGVGQLCEGDSGRVDDTLGQGLALGIEGAHVRVENLVIDGREDVLFGSQAGEKG